MRQELALPDKYLPSDLKEARFQHSRTKDVQKQKLNLCATGSGWADKEAFNQMSAPIFTCLQQMCDLCVNPHQRQEIRRVWLIGSLLTGSLTRSQTRCTTILKGTKQFVLRCLWRRWKYQASASYSTARERTVSTNDVCMTIEAMKWAFSLDRKYKEGKIKPSRALNHPALEIRTCPALTWKCSCE